MKGTHRILSLVLVLAMLFGMFAMTASADTASTAEVYDIRVDDLTAPVGLDDNPTFSWKMKSDAIGAAQTAYNVIVAEGSENVWDSGWINSDKSVAVEYAGPALAPSTEYTVKVAIKDETGAQTAYAVSTFETGLLSETPFADASWISYVPSYKSISNVTSYNIEFDVTVISGAANFVFGVQDTGNMFMWQFSASETNFRVRPHTKTNGGWASANVDVTSTVGSSADVLGKTLRCRIEVAGTTAKTYIALKGNELALVNTRTLSRSVPLNLVGFRGSTTETASFDNIVITDSTGGMIYSEDFEGTPYLTEVIPASNSYKVADGKLTVGDGATSFSENVTALTGRQISDVTSYTIDLDFVLAARNMGICFGVKGVKEGMMWQLNTTKSEGARIVPHRRAGGNWSTGIVAAADQYLTGEFANNAYFLNQKVHMKLVVDGVNTTTYLGRSEDALTEAFQCTLPAEVPLGNVGIRASSGEDCTYDNLVVRDKNGEVLYSESFDEMPMYEDLTPAAARTMEIVDGALHVFSEASGQDSFMFSTYTEPAEMNTSLPAYRKTVDVKADLVSAKLYTSGLGVYESYINGERVGRLMDDGSVAYDELKPGFTEMAVRKFYNAYDVTWMLKAGEENVLGAVVSSGWWSGGVARNLGQEDAYLAKLILTYGDGTTETVVTDTTWKTAAAANILAGTGIFPGERYDARVSQAWMLPGFDASDWANVKVNTEFKGTISAWSGVPITVREELELSPKEIYVYQGVTGSNATAYGTVNVLRTYNDGDAIVLNPGETLLVDLGQNFAGWEAFDLQAEAGTTITVEHGEMLNDGNGAHSRGNDGPEGSIYNENYRSASANTIYVASGAENESYHPSHTFYGFRYAEFTTDKTVTFTKIRGQVVTSSQEDTGVLVTSDKDVNQLVSNVRWGMYSNYLSVPTDCPQRDERQGWTADTQNFAEAGCYMGMSKTFLEKFMEDMRDSQRADGAYPGIAPTGSYSGASWGALGWADAGVIVPYFLYVMYGDTSVITDNWESMKLFMDSFMASTNGMGGGHAYGDWLAYEANNTEVKNMLGVSYYAWDALLMSKMAAAIGLEDEAQRYMNKYEEEKALFQSLYVKEDGTLIRTEQSVNLYALFLDLLPNEESVAAVSKVLIDNIERNGNKLQTGFLGTEIIMHTLTKIGRSDVAYKLLLQHDNPSWLYSVDQGATTIWERWNSYTLASGFGPVGMNSFNHYSYGSVASWMFRGMAGIGWDEAKPGFKHIVLTPQPDPLLQSVEATYESAYGPIVSNLNYGENSWTYDASIPANTTATIQIPVENIDTLTVNGSADLANAAGLTYKGYEDGIATFEAVAGSYSFVSHVATRYNVTMEAAAADSMMPPVAAEVTMNGKTVDTVLPTTLSVAEGTEVTVKAVPMNPVDYAVTGWAKGEAAVSESDTYTFTVTGDLSLTVNTDGIGLTSLAVGKTVTAGQVNASWAAANLTDGQNNHLGGVNGWSSPSTGSSTTFGSEVTAVIDLGAKTEFNEIRLYPRTFAPANVNFPTAYTIYTSDDNAAWTPVYSTDKGEVTNGYKPAVIELAETANARYVKLGVTGVNTGDENGTCYVQLSEMGVYYAGATEEEMLEVLANSALAALNIYRSTATFSDINAAEAAIAKAEAAVADYVNAGGSMDALPNYGYIATAKAAMEDWQDNQTTNYTIDFDFVMEKAAQGFSFGMKDTGTFIMWQLNAYKNAGVDKAVLLRPHFCVNGTWTDYPGLSGSNVQAVDVTEAIGYNTDTIFGKTIHQRIEVNGKEIKTYFGPDADNLTLASTYTHSEDVTLWNVGFRHNSSGSDEFEVSTYDNLVVRNGDGKVLFEEDFTDTDDVVLHSDNTVVPHAYVNGALKINNAEPRNGITIFVIGKVASTEEEPEVNPDQVAADAVIAQIAAIGEVTLESGEAIEAARAAYEALTDAQQALVTNLAVLEAAEAAYAELKAAAEQEAADKAAAAEVDALIAAIGEVTLESGEAIEAARAAYEALTETQQALVTSLTVLEAAEAAYAELTTPVDTDVTLVLTGEEETHVYDDEVVYTLSGKNMNRLATMTLTIELPMDVLEKPFAEGIGDWFVIGQVVHGNVLTVVVGNNAGANGEGDIMTITLEPTGEAGEAAVVITDAVLSAHDGEAEKYVDAILEEASFTTTIKHSPYDVNKDGVVDQLDLTRAQRWYGSDNKDADVNTDGTVNIDDLILILNNYDIPEFQF